MEKIFEHTARSLGQFTRFITCIFDNNDENIISYCRNEYGTDWQWAYHSYKKSRRFPNHLDSVNKAA